MIDRLSQRLNILFKYETLQTGGVPLKLTQLLVTLMQAREFCAILNCIQWPSHSRFLIVNIYILA